MTRKKSVISFVLAACCLCLALGGPARAGQTKDKPLILTLATATKGGTFYPLGLAMAKLWNDRLENKSIYCKVVDTAGSKQSLEMLGNEAQLAVIQGMFGKMAWRGLGPYKEASKRNLRAVCMLWPNVEHFVIDGGKVKSGTPLDIKGLSFVLGGKNSGTAQSGLEIMKGLGLTIGDIKPLYMGYEDAAEAFTVGKAQGANLASGPPNEAVTDIFKAGKHKPVILQFSEAQLAAINNNTFYPGFRYVIPPDTYPGQKKAVHTIAQPNLLVCDASLAEQVVHDLLRVLMTHEYYLAGAHPMGRHIGLNNALRGLPMPLHKGALRYYQEQGLILPQSQRAQAK